MRAGCMILARMNLVTCWHKLIIPIWPARRNDRGGPPGDGSRYRRNTAPLPDFISLSAGDEIRTTAGTWRIRTDTGHSDDQISLMDHNRDLFLSVDFFCPGYRRIYQLISVILILIYYQPILPICQTCRVCLKRCRFFPGMTGRFGGRRTRSSADRSSSSPA